MQMANPSSPEFRLAAACAICPSADRRADEIRVAAAEPIDWPHFMRVAKRHQVVGLVHHGLRHAEREVPASIRREIGEQAASSTRENLAMAREALRLQEEFDAAKLPVIFVKGASLAVLAYGDMGLRGSKDIDLVVPVETLPAATSLLTRAGYRRFDPPPEIGNGRLGLLMSLRRDFGFVHQITGLRLELHWRLFLNPHTMSEASIMAASRLVPLTGTMGLRTLGEEDLFAYLCAHGALHRWNQLKWLADIDALLATFSGGKIERIVLAAEARGVGRSTAQAMLLCRQVLRTPMPAPLIATFDRGLTVSWLVTTGLQAMNIGRGALDPREVRFGTTRGAVSLFLLNRSWRYRLAEFNYLLTNQTDVLTVALPEKLWFLYPFLRLPLWLWRHFRKSSHR
jgi:hypothetical protein